MLKDQEAALYTFSFQVFIKDLVWKPASTFQIGLGFEQFPLP